MSTESPRVILCVETTMLKKLIWVTFCLAMRIAAAQKFAQKWQKTATEIEIETETKIKTEIERARARPSLFHIWFHPHYFVSQKWHGGSTIAALSSSSAAVEIRVRETIKRNSRLLI